MNEFDRLYEALIANPDDHLALNELWALMGSSDPNVAAAAEQVISEYLRWRPAGSRAELLIRLAG